MKSDRALSEPVESDVVNDTDNCVCEDILHALSETHGAGKPCAYLLTRTPDLYYYHYLIPDLWAVSPLM
jgi:hypothetical protein